MNKETVRVLQKIRKEIEQHRKKTASIDKYDLLGDALSIIDKALGEVGEKE